MILTTHIISGAALGANVQNTYAVAGLSVILHFLLDLIPHGDYLNKKSRLREFWKVAVDLAIGISIVVAVISIRGETSNNVLIQNVGIGIFFSLLPDATTFFYIWMKMKFLKPVKDFHESLHRAENGSLERKFRFKNNLWDIILTLVFFLIFIFF
ncbi:MAG: hypothetical protein A3J76_00405 [Candidatus Moranbacteria bacterium RBG_13_45_13]|nr:MAG: hypothetical protein A3J76_00405 [Candidatus Moranbacteria bacterium RBG_13_45_13]